MVGDIALLGLHLTEPEKNDERFRQIGPVLQRAGMVFANLEVPIGAGSERNEQKKIIHAGDAQITEMMLKRLNIGCVSLANNHIYDCMMDGLMATINLLDKMGIRHTGAGWKKEHVEPVILDLPDRRVGFVAYVDKGTNPGTEHFPEARINYFELEKARQDITALKNVADKVICSIHWGRDYSHYPTPAQMEQARHLVNSGADVIMGHHPHVLQAYEKYKDGQIFYSLGNLTYGDFYWEGKLRALRRKTKQGIIVQIGLMSSECPQLIGTTELPGNRIILNMRNLYVWMRRKMRIAESMAKHVTLRRAIALQEAVMERFMEFGLGYYRNPFRDIFNKTNWKKLGFMKRDYVDHKKN